MTSIRTAKMTKNETSMVLELRSNLYMHHTCKNKQEQENLKMKVKRYHCCVCHKVKLLQNFTNIIASLNFKEKWETTTRSKVTETSEKWEGRMVWSTVQKCSKVGGPDILAHKGKKWRAMGAGTIFRLGEQKLVKKQSKQSNSKYNFSKTFKLFW